tara:strand:+ start:2398 stop:2811 length:414 start_codon:yes stop_codon:yes gene_type:complete
VSLIDFLERENSKKAILSEATERILESVSFNNITVPSLDLPVDPSDAEWTTLSDPERLFREYTFFKFSHLMYFVTESLRHQNEQQHHAKMTIDGMSVYIETYTHDINSITQQDLNLARYLDEIYSDVSFLNMDLKND